MSAVKKKKEKKIKNAKKITKNKSTKKNQVFKKECQLYLERRKEN